MDAGLPRCPPWTGEAWTSTPGQPAGPQGVAWRRMLLFFEVPEGDVSAGQDRPRGVVSMPPRPGSWSQRDELF